MRSSSILAMFVAICGTTGCIEYLEPGELGQMRYIDDVQGEPSLPMVAPTADRDGNIYVLYGARDLTDVRAYVARDQGGWYGGCEIHENNSRGMHGWIGRDFDHVWYWSGDAVARVGWRDGCKDVLDRDPATAADIAFEGVVPWVEDTPSITETVALISSPSDPVPFFAVIDLRVNQYTDIDVFQPRNAKNVVVLGTGANPSSRDRVMIVAYDLGEDHRVEARFLGDDAEVTDVVRLDGLDAYEEDAVLGFLVQNDAGWFSGALEDGRVLVVGRGGGGVQDLDDLEVAGVHHWDGEVYAVGTNEGQPAIARLRADAKFEPSRVWTTSKRVTTDLARPLEVMDDRARPVRYETWSNPRSGVGPHPFVQPHSPHRYAVDTSLLLVAGPTFQTGGVPFTSVSVGPVGLSYP